MQDANRRFAEMAHPHSWYMTAENLHAQALYLGKSRGRSRITFQDHVKGASTWWDGDNRTMFLLGGFALENAIKAFLVYENPNWISNGRLARHIRSHSLTKLQAQVVEIPYKRQYVWVLKQFEAGIDSWSRYPCALTAEETFQEGHMHATLWGGYLRVMDAYGNRLRTLLSKPWKGPHGVAGTYAFYSGPLEEGEGMGRKGFKPLSAAKHLR
ncbi:hypothetical protein [Mesorhizobium sp. M8A.F.Ca.ET.207.01.1.1]|uniref:hypothetical protein n=1 Tax=Mesorhizobium sp. M8A.F.Ca.ET.207.01.1.1 TaxID=2563968 RepID=UPI00167996CE|nr:hypothetical protein [Mesorhizobium sp. M8A.F.Ca.ET.207.01.1.1]